MPTTKSRSSWIIDPELVERLKQVAALNRRTISAEAESAIAAWIERHKNKIEDR